MILSIAGPNIRLACHIVRDMVDAGHADIVMGNHEYNVVTYLTEAPPGFNQPYLRQHTKRNNFIVEQTLQQFANYQQEFREFLDWFITLPLFLDYEHFRVVPCLLGSGHDRRIPAPLWR